MSVRLIDPVCDMDRAVGLYMTCFAEPPWWERFDADELRAEFAQTLTWPDTIFLVTEDDDGKVIGGAVGFNVCRKPGVCELIADADRNSFYVAELFVDPNARVKGVCRTMTTSMLTRAHYRGFTRASVRTSVDQGIIRHMFVDGLSFKIMARQEVTSTKWIDGIEQDVPDARILMTGAIPDYGAIERERLARVCRGGMCEH
jgi:ribosomal protein S18 acetylase RimI-like enzyme